LCNFNNIFIFNELTKLVLLIRSIREILIIENLNIDCNYYAIAINNSKNEFIANFQNTISLNNKIILVNEINCSALFFYSNNLFSKLTFLNKRTLVF